MERLLAPDGCPWDRAQTPESLRSYVIEEAYEVVEAIDEGQPDGLRQELGDLLFQVVFHAALASRKGDFGLDGVIAAICEKMERRHPHVFGDDTADDVATVRRRWEEIKQQESGRRGLLDGIPRELPALLAAHKVGQRAARVGLDFDCVAAARQKVLEEIAELDAALLRGDRGHAEQELGDVLFSVVNWARKTELDPEVALRGAVNRFRDRVAEVSALAKADGAELGAITEQALDELWERAKAGVSRPY